MNKFIKYTLMGVSCGNVKIDTKRVLDLKAKYPEYHLKDPLLTNKYAEKIAFVNSEILLCDHYKIFPRYKEELQKSNPDLYKKLFIEDLGKQEFEVRNLREEDEIKFLYFFNKIEFKTLKMIECYVKFPQFAIQYFPSYAKRNSTLTSISINGSNLEFVEDHENYLRMSGLVNLDMSFNSIEDISDKIRRFGNLRNLNLRRNNFRKIPKLITDLEKLVEMNLSENKIKFIESYLFKSNAEKIDLSMNMIEEIEFNPKLIKSSKLKYFYLNYNEIKQIYDSFGNFPNLQHLALDYNKITEASYSFKNVKTKLLITLNGNPLRNTENISQLDYGAYSNKLKQSGEAKPSKETKDKEILENDNEKNKNLLDDIDILIKEEKSKDNSNYLEGKLLALLEETLSNIKREEFISDQAYKDKFIQKRLQLIYDELQNIITHNQESQIALFKDLGLKSEIKFCYGVMNKIRTFKVSKIQPQLSQKELFLFKYGLNGKKEEVFKEKSRNEGDKDKQENEAIEEIEKKENSLYTRTKSDTCDDKLKPIDDMNNLKFLENLRKFLLGYKLKFFLNVVANIDSSFREYLMKIIIENQTNSLILFLSDFKIFLEHSIEFYSKNATSALEIQFKYYFPSSAKVVQKVFVNVNTLKMLYKLGLKEIIEKEPKVAVFVITHSVNAKQKFLHNFLERFIDYIKFNEKDLHNIF